MNECMVLGCNEKDTFEAYFYEYTKGQRNFNLCDKHRKQLYKLLRVVLLIGDV